MARPSRFGSNGPNPHSSFSFTHTHATPRSRLSFPYYSHVRPPPSPTFSPAVVCHRGSALLSIAARAWIAGVARRRCSETISSTGYPLQRRFPAFARVPGAKPSRHRSGSPAHIPDASAPAPPTAPLHHRNHQWPTRGVDGRSGGVRRGLLLFHHH